MKKFIVSALVLAGVGAGRSHFAGGNSLGGGGAE